MYRTLSRYASCNCSVHSAIRIVLCHQSLFVFPNRLCPFLVTARIRAIRHLSFNALAPKDPCEDRYSPASRRVVAPSTLPPMCRILCCWSLVGISKSVVPFSSTGWTRVLRFTITWNPQSLAVTGARCRGAQTSIVERLSSPLCLP